MPMRGTCLYVRETLESIVKDVGNHFSMCITFSELNFSVEDMVQSIAPEAKVRYITADRLSLAQALNIAVKSSTKKYILRIDSDDNVITGRTSKQFKFLEENPDIAVVGSQVVLIDKFSNRIGQSEYDTKTFSEEFGFGCRLAHPSVMFRRDQIMSVGNYQDICNLQGWSFCEDYDLWLRVLELYGIGILDEPLTEYRIHGSQLTQKFEVEVFLCSLLLRFRKILGEPRMSIIDNDLSLDSPAIKKAISRMRLLNTPESRVWLLEYAIFTLRKYPSILRTISKSKTMYFTKNLNLWFFCLRYVLRNQGSYKRELANHRSGLSKKN